MTSINGADPVYYAEGPSLPLMYEYRPGSVMDYIYRKCSVFALCLQKSDYDEWVDAPDFNSTIFIPCESYSHANLEHFKRIDYSTARDLTLTSVISNQVDAEHLTGQDLLPTHKGSYLKVVTDIAGELFINGLWLRESVRCDNGIIHVVGGFISLEENYLD